MKCAPLQILASVVGLALLPRAAVLVAAGLFYRVMREIWENS